MSIRYPSIVLSDLPRGLSVTISTDYGKDTPVVPTDSQRRILSEGVREMTTRIEEVLKRPKPAEGARRVMSRIDEIFERTRPIDNLGGRYTSPVEPVDHQTRMVRRRLKEGDCLPEELARLKPFHIYHNEDGSLELYWLVNSQLQRVG